MLTQPEFWTQPRHPYALALSPIGAIYGLTASLLPKAKKDIAIPSLCVGNATMGGTGKTPVVRRLAEALTAADLRPHIISRGYKSKADHAIRVNPAQHSVADVGDEPLMMAYDSLPCWVGSSRIHLAEAAMQAGASCIISDDGMQSQSLNFTTNIMVVDGPYGFGNQRTFPAGPLRQRLMDALQVMDHAIIIGDDAHNLAPMLEKHGKLWHAHLNIDLSAIQPVASKKLYAFAGIGRPTKFFDSIQNAGLNLLGTQSFPDHHLFSESDLTALHTRAESLDATLVCTEKDWVRLSDVWQQKTFALPATLDFQDPHAIPAMLEEVV